MATVDEEEYSSSNWKIFKFDGNKATFREWKIKTKAYARRKKFATGFTEDYSSSKDEKEIKIRENAMDYLIGALEGAAFTKVTTKTEDDPYEAWAILEDSYQQDDVKDLDKVQADLVNLRMESGEKPSDFASKIDLMT